MPIEKEALVILKGDPPTPALFKRLQEAADLIVCADGAADYLKEFDVGPDLVIGDFDSISKKSISATETTEYLEMADQEFTDGEKALRYCNNRGFNRVSVTGAFGGRLDHSLYNIELLKKMLDLGLTVTCYTNTEKVFLADESVRLNDKPGARISFTPIFGPVRGVTTQGLEWDLDKVDLEFGRFSSISNRITSSPAEIKFSKGELLIFVEHHLS